LNDVIESVGKTELSNSFHVGLLKVEYSLWLVVSSLKKQILEEFPRLTVVDDLPEHHCLFIVCPLEWG